MTLEIRAEGGAPPAGSDPALEGWEERAERILVVVLSIVLALAAAAQTYINWYM